MALYFVCRLGSVFAGWPDDDPVGDDPDGEPAELPVEADAPLGVEADAGPLVAPVAGLVVAGFV
jgi:hypothetical protein